MNNKKYIYLLVFISLLVVLDRSIGYVIERNFDKVTKGVCGNINNSLKVDAELLICGSSRAQHHYVPELLSKQLNLSCYNAGLGGYGIFYNYALISSKVKTSKPKVILLDLAPNVIDDPKSYSKLNALLPYIHTNKAFLEAVKLNPDYSFLNTISMLYIYNSTLYEIINSMLSAYKVSDGYIPLSTSIDTLHFSPFSLEAELIDKNKLEYFNKTIKLCKDNEVELFVFVSPTYRKFDNKNTIIGHFENLCKKQGIPFYDFSDYAELYGKSRYFKDQLHMNNKGAEIYTNEIVKVLDLSLRNKQNR